MSNGPVIFDPNAAPSPDVPNEDGDFVPHNETEKLLLAGIEGEIEQEDFMRRLRYRSEEHTSELQSHEESSYAVFCLKKKTRS